MNEHKESIKYETFEQFWDDVYGEEYGYSNKYTLEPYYSIAQYAWEMGENHGYYLGKDYGNTNRDANLNYDSWHENEDINLKLKILENENDELKHKLRQARKLLMLSKKECIYNGDEFQTEYRIKCNDFIGEIKCYEMENKGE